MFRLVFVIGEDVYCCCPGQRYGSSSDRSVFDLHFLSNSSAARFKSRSCCNELLHCLLGGRIFFCDGVRFDSLDIFPSDVSNAGGVNRTPVFYVNVFHIFFLL